MRGYEKYKDSGIEWIGKVPKHWGITKLSYYCEIKDGTHDTPKYVEQGGYPLVTQKDINNGVLDFDKTKNISEEDYLKINKRSNVEQGDIIMAMIGSIGNPAIVDTDRPFSIKNVCLFKTSQSLEDTRFLHYQLSSDAIVTELIYNSRGGVQGFVPLEVLRNLRHIKPPLQEQTAIANFLDHKTRQIDTAIEQHRELIELLREHRAALINEAVTKGINPDVEMKDSGVEWIGAVPGHWDVKKLKYLVQEIQGGGTPSTNKPEYWKGDIPWVSPKDMKSDYIAETQDYVTKLGVENSTTNLIPAGSILMVVRSGILKHTLPIAINLCEVALNQDMKAMIPIESISRDYFKLMHDGLENEILIFCSKVGATVDSIDMLFYLNFLFPVPPLAEQRQIVEYVKSETTRIDTELQAIETEIHLLEEYRQSLIAEAVTGKIDVRDYVLPAEETVSEESEG